MAMRSFLKIFFVECVKKITPPAGSAKIYFVGKIQFARLYCGAGRLMFVVILGEKHW